MRAMVLLLVGSVLVAAALWTWEPLSVIPVGVGLAGLAFFVDEDGDQ